MHKIVDEPKILRYEYDIQGNRIPVLSCKVETVITNMKTGETYTSDSEVEKDINNPTTTTVASDIKRDVTIFAPKLFTGAATPKK